MTVSDDVLELVRILTAEGFGVLAGEILSAVSLGQEIEQKVEDVPFWTSTADDLVELEKGRTVQRRYKDVMQGKSIPPPRRRQMTDEEQILFVADYIALRLVEPARRLAEAERIAGRLAILPEPPPPPIKSAQGDAETGSAEGKTSGLTEGLLYSADSARDTVLPELPEKALRISFIEVSGERAEDDENEIEPSASETTFPTESGNASSDDPEAFIEKETLTPEERTPGSEVAIDRLSAVLDRLRTGIA